MMKNLFQAAKKELLDACQMAGTVIDNIVDHFIELDDQERGVTASRKALAAQHRDMTAPQESGTQSALDEARPLFGKSPSQPG